MRNGGLTIGIVAAVAATFGTAAAAPPTTATKPAATAPAAAAPIDPALAKQTARLLARLEAPDYKERERATQEVEALPAAALPLIEDALADGGMSPEVRVRLADRVSVLRRKVASTKYETMLRGVLAWDRDTMLRAYEQGGHANPKWDAAAREAIVLHVRPRRDPNVSPADKRRTVDAFKRAFDLGCDDPLLRYRYWHLKLTSEKPVPGVDVRTKIAPIRKACEEIVAGNYPPIFRMEAAMRLCEEAIFYNRFTPEMGKRVNEHIELAISLVEPAIQDGAPRHALMAILPNVEKFVHTMERNRGLEGHARMMKLIRPVAKGTTIPAFLDADFWIWRGHNLRANRDYRDPGEKGDRLRKLLAETVANAKAAVDEGLKPDPEDPDAVNRMLRYLSMTAAPREEFEKWFDTAMRLYPNDLPACQVKLAYLATHVGAEAQLEFGRWCVAHGNWTSRIPLILIDAHANLASDPHDPAVWEEMSATFEGYLKRFPQAHVDRTHYLKAACIGEHWLVAKEQFDKLGDDLAWNLFDSQQRIDDCRRKADEAAKAVREGEAPSEPRVTK